jgi:hypothetical protein
MMGRQTGDQSQLFYLFNLERRIPASHLLRLINPIVTQILIELRAKLTPFYSEIGRPSIDPDLMIRMLIVGYCYGIRSERRLCEELELHLAYRWFCRRRRGVYICPNNKVLHTSGTAHEGYKLRYRASKLDCEVCALKKQCCPKGPSREVPRDIHEYARDVTRRLMRTKAFLKSRDQRKRVEMRFAHLKVHHRFERMRLRGLSGARDEFVLAATVQNLKTLALRTLGSPPAQRRVSSA